MKYWFPVEVSRSRLLGALVLSYGSSQATLYKQSICKTHTPPQNNKESASIWDRVGTLEAVDQEIRCCLKLFTVYCLWRQGLDSVQRELLSLAYDILVFPSEVISLPLSSPCFPRGCAWPGSQSRTDTSFGLQLGVLLGTETSFSKENDLNVQHFQLHLGCS